MFGKWACVRVFPVCPLLLRDEQLKRPSFLGTLIMPPPCRFAEPKN